ncbi:hypothetical protein DAI22_11g201700 [Oryza sativa Japonica Group]|nr:hypothetical protein DAI22_11g201700 [Oryza sativa Japonica Group]
MHLNHLQAHTQYCRQNICSCKSSRAYSSNAWTSPNLITSSVSQWDVLGRCRLPQECYEFAYIRFKDNVVIRIKTILFTQLNLYDP